MKRYSVKQLANMAGVSVRTLHLYDEKGLLRPAGRTDAGYRWYGEPELLQLQQILFFKELDFPLQAIRDILKDPDFDKVKTLESHRQTLQSRQKRIAILLNTIEKTISYLTNDTTMKHHEELYEGFPKGVAYREEAIQKWGSEAVEQSEAALMQRSKPDFESLKNDMTEVSRQLFNLKGQSVDKAEVQALISRHYNLIKAFWGKTPSAEAYKGLGELYLADERYTMHEGEPQPAFAAFLSTAMTYFAEHHLKG